jgi:hypothetical protein
MIDYRKKIEELLVAYRKAGIRVHFVPRSVLKDFGGMNDEAAKQLGFRRLPDDTILVDKSMKLSDQYVTLLHEPEEMVRMEKLHGKYWPEHIAALRHEKRGPSQFLRRALAKGV